MVVFGIFDNFDVLIVCNGYKDRAYFEMAFLAQCLGCYSVIVFDRFIEVDVLIKTVCEFGIQPYIGVRARFVVCGEGKWVESSGDRAKFGFSASEIVQTVQR